MSWQNPFARPNGNTGSGNNPGGNQQRQPGNQSATQQASSGPANSQFQTPTGAPNVNGNPGQPGNQQQSQNPLDALAPQIWGEPAKPQQGQQGQQPPQGQQPAGPAYDGYLVPWDNGQMQQALGRVDFMRGANQEAMQKVMAGDMSALPDLLNHVGRQAYQMAAQTAHGFVDRGVKTGLDRFGGSLDDRFRDYEVRRQTPDDDLISHPANAPIFEMIKQQVARNNPDMPPQKVKETATQWFKQMGNAINSSQQSQNQNQNQQPEHDWAAELGVADDPNGAFGSMPPQGGNQPQGQNGGFF